MFDKRLDRALKFQRERNGHAEETAHTEFPARVPAAGEPEADAVADALSPGRMQGEILPQEDLHPGKAIHGAEEKVGAKEMFLMILSAWGIFIPVAVVILLAMVLIARFLFGV